MAQSYTRQSSFSDGDTITAALFNNEYNQLVNAFTYSSSSASTTGHRHDGTAAHGGNIHTIGDLDFLNKIVADSTNNRWGIFVEVSSAAVEQIRIQDGAIVPVTDNDIDLGTSSLEFKDAYFDGTITTDLLTVSGTTNLDGAIQVDNTITVGVDDTGYDVKFFGDTASAYMLWDTSTDDLVLAGAAGLDIAGDIDVDGTSNLDNTDIDGTLAVDGTTISLDATTSLNIDNSNTSNGITIGTATSGVPISIGHSTSEVTVNDNLTVTGTLTLGSGAELTEAELEMLDGITAGTVAASKAVVVDSNKDIGTFRNVTIDGTFSDGNYTFDTSGNVSGLGTIGSGAITSSGTIQGTTITATTAFVPDASDGAALGTSALEFSDLFLADGAVINFGDDQDVSLTHVADTGLLLSSTDQLQFGDSGTYIYQSADGVLDLVSDTEIELTATTIDINGAVAMDGAITGGTNITISGELDAATLDISGNADIDGTLEADAYTVDGTALNEYIADTVGAMVGSNTETNITVTYEDSDNTLDFVIGTLNQDTTGTADNITISANNSTDETVYPIFVDGATGSQGAESDTGLTYNPSSGLLTITGELDAGSLDISGNADIDGTLEADAYTVDGTALNEYIADTVGAMVGSNTETNITVTYEDGDNTLDFVIGTLNQDTTGLAATATALATARTIGGTSFDGTANIAVALATEGTNVTVSANNSTDETVYPTFVDGATGTQGIETDTGFTYNPSSGLLTISGELDAGSLDISGNADIDGTLETDNLTVGGAQGSDGQVLTSTGSGVAWEDPVTGTTTIDGLSDAKSAGTNFTGSLIIGHQTTGTLDEATYNTAVGLTAMNAITSGDHNIAFGYDALGVLTTGSTNVGIGTNAGDAITTGGGNIGIGFSAVSTVTTGSYNIGIGRDALKLATSDNNVAIGHEAMENTSTGASNVAVGYQSLTANTTGTQNAALGAYALDAATTADGNTAIGYFGLSATTTGAQNTALGTQALAANTTGSYNTALGAYALDANTTANNNVGIGYAALGANTTGTQNIAIGFGSLDAITTASYNVGVGHNVLTSNTSGEENVAIGNDVLLDNSTGGNNVAVGSSALANNTTASNNVAIGRHALLTNTTGAENIAIGKGALDANTTASSNVGIGNNALGANTTGAENVAVGAAALDANTTASSNTAVGYAALTANTTGTQNSAFGRGALDANTTGNYNMAFGSHALGANTTASNNVAVGYQSLAANTTGTRNVAVGTYSLDANTTANDNTAVGYNAATAITTGTSNTAIGASSLLTLTTGSRNTSLGYNALTLQTDASDNVAIGNYAGGAITTGAYNTFVGSLAGDGLTTGGSNTGVGYRALSSASFNASNCTAVGRDALVANTTGSENTAVGQNALDANTTGQGNTCVGQSALGSNTTASNNTAMGVDALNSNTTGANNTAFGKSAQSTTGSGSNNTTIGYDTRIGAADGQGQIVIGSSVYGTTNTRVHIGNSSSHIYNNYNSNATWTHSSDERAKKDIELSTLGLEFINDLKPATYKFRSPSEYPEEWVSHDKSKTEPIDDKPHHGMIAQDIKKALDKAGVDDFEGWDELPDGKQQISESMFVFPLIKAVQELSAEVEQLKQQLKEE